MARYWMYLNGSVEGPFAVEQLIRRRGFSRQTLVCVEDASGQPQNWISPADIPELAHIFRAIDENSAESLPSSSKPVMKRPLQARRPYTPAVTLKLTSRFSAVFWGWVLLFTLLAGGGSITWFLHARHATELQNQQEVRRLIENVHLSANARFGSLAQYLQENAIVPRWQYEKKLKNLYCATLSWYAQGSSGGAQTLEVYAFEVNTQAQSVRAINSAAAKFLTGSLSSSSPGLSPKKVSKPLKAKTPPSFDGVIRSQLDAISAGDFHAVWSRFSKRKRAEMLRAGMSQEGYIRLQGLTHRLESGSITSLIKIKEESATEQLVLLKQAQTGRSDIFIKQLWINEDGEWKLDDEQKRSAQTAELADVNETAPESPPAPATPATRSILPGMSN